MTDQVSVIFLLNPDVRQLVLLELVMREEGRACDVSGVVSERLQVLMLLL